MFDYFPYPLREEQKGFIEFLRENVLRSNVCIHAPTGFGKTPLVLAALLPLAKEHGLKIIWVTKTGNETDRPIEELKGIWKLGKGVFGLSFRGKRDMCLLTAGVKDLSQDEASYICRAKGGEVCEAKEDLGKFLGSPMLYSEILQACKYSCPYRVQRQLLGYADVVALSYNYVLSEGISWAIRQGVSFEDSILVVDEAHNLPNAAMNMNSDSISFNAIARASKELAGFREGKARELRVMLKLLSAELVSAINGEDAVFDPQSLKIDGLKGGVKAMEKYGNRTRKKMLEAGKRPSSSLYRLSRFLRRFFEISDTEGVKAIVSPRGLEIFDMRSRESLKDVWKNFRSCVFISGTLSPLQAFSETIGMKGYAGRVFESGFDLSGIRTFITSDLSTQGMELVEEMKEKYALSIESFLSLNETNSAVFFSSYRVQNELMDGIQDVAASLGKKVFAESQWMKGSEGRNVLDGFKKCSEKGNGLLLASMQGRFAEGADFPGKELEAVFIAGVPFDRLNTKTRLLIDYHKKTYGNEKGQLYGYVLPALRRTAQSLGRALRSGEDRAFFVLGDRRYRGFLEYLPDYVRKTAVTISSAELGNAAKVR